MADEAAQRELQTILALAKELENHLQNERVRDWLVRDTERRHAINNAINACTLSLQLVRVRAQRETPPSPDVT